ncbi:MAG: DNRLRE domain-containing protein [Candidatus Saganbacteria bacterium]|nr:DNRLRE domain-containing protein [Candidatus Saganbacteria bacterium]
MKKNLFYTFILIIFAYVFFVGCGNNNGGGGTATLKQILVSPSSVTVNISGTQKFSALGLYSNNTVASITPTWSVSNTCGTIDSTGKFYAGSVACTGEVRASLETISASVTVTVSTGGSSQLSSIEVTPSSYNGRVNQTRTFTAVGRNASGEVVAMTPVWDVTGGVGTIGATGIFTATATGSGTVVCTSGEVSRSVPVTIEGYYLIVTAEADTYIDSANPTTEYSTSTELNISYIDLTTHIQDSYISFDVSAINSSKTIVKATLEVYVTSASLKTYILKKINNAWIPTITYATKPSTTGYEYVNSLDNPSTGRFNSVSVTDLISGWVTLPVTNKGIYICKPTDSDGGMVILSSKSSYKPRLLITYQ